MRALQLGNSLVSDESDAYVIAEIGHNHEGDLATAEELVRQAAKAGAQAVKFQKRDNASLYTEAMYRAPYTGRNSFGRTYGAHREALELGRDDYLHLAKVARAAGIDFMATAFDRTSVDFLVAVGVQAIKIASGDLTNTPLLRYAAAAGKPLVVSTGGGDMADVRRAVDAITPITSDLAVLQCTAVYPADADQLNLSVISSYRKAFPGLVIGFSGHDFGIEMSPIAYALGARIVEKHFTLDHDRPGSDHHFSLDPAQLLALVEGLRRARRALGSPRKQALAAERPALLKMGKKLVAAHALPAGHVLTEDDIAIRSPGDGLPPYHLSTLVGRQLRCAVAADGDLEFDQTAGPA